MDTFITYILCEMTAVDFAKALRQTDIPRGEQDRLIKLAIEREAEMIYEHIMWPNEF